MQKVWSRCYGNERSEDINMAIFVQMKKNPPKQNRKNKWEGSYVTAVDLKGESYSITQS